MLSLLFFFFNDTPTTDISPLPLHDALPIFTDRRYPIAARRGRSGGPAGLVAPVDEPGVQQSRVDEDAPAAAQGGRSEEHTSELQSRQYLVCRLLLEKKKKIKSVLNTVI